jgi:hypothetical protein
MKVDLTALEQSVQESEVRRNHSEKAFDNRQAKENALPKDKRAALKQIVANKAEPHHVRSEAQHILDIGDTLPAAEFVYRFSEFMEFYKTGP